MILNYLPQNVENQVVKLLGDEQFQERISQDKVIGYLQAQKHNKDIEFQELQLLLHKKNTFKRVKKETEVTTVDKKGLFKRIITAFKKLFSHKVEVIDDKLELKPITLALYSYLYTLKSNIIFDVDKIDLIDLDLFFYLLQTKEYSYDYKSVLLKSCDYCQKVLKLNYNQIIAIFNRIYSIQFRVFALFPRISDDEEEPCFNVDWMLNIASKVTPYVSYTTEEIFTDISVSQIYYWYAQYLRNNGDNSVFVRNQQEILDEIDSRAIELVIDRLIQKKIINATQREEYFNLMKYVKENTNG